MNSGRVRRVLKWEYLLLLLVMGLAFYMTFIPHLDYPYPVHLDEWSHLACSNEIIKEASASNLSSPFSGGAPSQNQTFEVGYHLLWAIFHQISGIPWVDIFRYFPSIVFMVTVLSVYIMARREGFGWEAAFFTCLIPTTVGILGPAFMVPMAVGLLFIPLSLFVVFNFRTLWSYLVLSVFISFLISSHGPMAVILTIILFPYILYNLRNNTRHSLATAIALVIPLLVTLPWTYSKLMPSAISLFTDTPVAEFIDIPRVIVTYGYFPIIFCLLGSFLLVNRGGGKNYGLVLGLLVLIAMLAVFFTLHYGVPILYYRGLTPMMLMMGIVAGAGLMGVRRLRIPGNLVIRGKVSLVARSAGIILCLALTAFTLALAIPGRQSIPYYHMIDDEDYQSFVWIKENVDSSYEMAVLDPWKGTAFTAITGKYVYTAIGEYPMPKDNEAYTFLEDGCRDTAYLRENGISIVYTRGECLNPDLTEIREGIYILK